MRSRRFLKRTALLLAGLYILGTFFGGMGLGWMALHPGRLIVNAEDARRVLADAGRGAQLDEVAVTAADGAVLRAWHIRPAAPNGDTVILLHGVGDNRLGVAGYGTWLARNGYTVVLPDARGHGVSGGEITT